jgi:hypothetical protein
VIGESSILFSGIYSNKKRADHKMTGISSKKLLFSALTWIEKKKNDENVDKENVEVGIECLRYALSCIIWLENKKNRNDFYFNGV